MSSIVFVAVISPIDIPEASAANITITCSGQTISQVGGAPGANEFNSGDNLTLDGAGTCVLNGVVSLGTLTVGDGVDATVLTHDGNTDTKVNYLDITTTGNVVIAANSSIDVSAKGYAATEGPGAGANGSILVGGGGGGHGGDGGDVPGGGGAGGTAYDVETAPVDLGSGGGEGRPSNAGAGGGYVRMNIDGNLTINANAAIRADGQNATLQNDGSGEGGGGAGGSLYLTVVGAIGGTGAISANGGNGADSGFEGDQRDGGGGAGGRVRLEYITNNRTPTVTGGTSSTAGATGDDGTVSTAAIAVPNTPSIVAPAKGLGQIATSGFQLDGSTYSALSTHDSTDWKITTDAAGSNIVWSKDDATGAQRTSIVVNVANGTFSGALAGKSALDQATTYYAFVRYTNGIGDSSWSATGHSFVTSYAGTATEQIWDFNEANANDNVDGPYKFNSTNIEANVAGGLSKARLKDLGGGNYKSIGVDGTLNRKTITITNPGAGLINHQVLLNVGYEAGLMQTDFDDLRFTNANGDKLDYWIESKIDGSVADVWVEVDNLPASSDTVIYMYYNNSNLSSESSAANTFIANQIYAQSGTNTTSVTDMSSANAVRNKPVNLSSGLTTKIDWGSYHDGSAFNSSVRDNFYQRFRFLFVPSTSGSWHFALNSDDGSQLILSPYDLDDPTETAVFVNDYYGLHGTCGDPCTTQNTERGGYSAVSFASGEAKWMDVVMAEASAGEALRLHAKAPSGSYNIFNTTNFAGQIYARSYASSPLTVKWDGVSSSALAGWSKRAAYSIYNSGAQLTNYQVKIEVPYDSSMQADFDDLRFTSSDGTTLIDFWIQDYTASTSATVWVEVPTVAATGNTIIYMYYDNGGAVAASDIDETFLFGDDFSGALDVVKWPTTNGTPATSGGNLVLDTAEGVLSGYVIPDDTVWESSADPQATNREGSPMRGAPSSGAGFVGDAGAGVLDILWWNNGAWYAEWGAGEAVAGNYASGFKKYKIIYKPGAVNQADFIYNDGESTYTRVNNIPSSLKPTLYSHNGQSLIDYFFVRKYSSTEPVAYALGGGVSAGSYSDIAIYVDTTNGVHPTATKILSFSDVTSGGGTVKYQLSVDGTNWKYHDGSSWTAASTDSLHNNTETEVNNYIGSFLSNLSLNSGDLYFKAFLVGDGTQQVTIDSIKISYDAGSPIALSNFTTTATTATTATFGWTPPQEDSFNRYEIVYGTSQNDVNTRTLGEGAAIWDNDSAAGLNLTTLSTNSTTITGLTVGATYYAKLYAFDDFNNFSTVATISFSTNQIPTVTSFTGTENLNGSGEVTLTFTIDDPDDDDNLRVKVEYDSGNGWTKATLSNISNNTTSTFGSPTVDNNQTYQIGTVPTSSGANTLSVVWTSKTDVGSLSGVKVRITPFDTIADGTALTTPSVSLGSILGSTSSDEVTISGAGPVSSSIYMNNLLASSTDGAGNFSFSQPLGIVGTNFYLIKVKSNGVESIAQRIVVEKLGASSAGGGGGGGGAPSSRSVDVDTAVATNDEDPIPEDTKPAAPEEESEPQQPQETPVEEQPVEEKPVEQPVEDNKEETKPVEEKSEPVQKTEVKQEPQQPSQPTTNPNTETNESTQSQGGETDQNNTVEKDQNNTDNAEQAQKDIDKKKADEKRQQLEKKIFESVKDKFLGEIKTPNDKDKDGVPDDAEVGIYKTDPFNPDTDEDGLLDSEEIFDLGSDPLKKTDIKDLLEKKPVKSNIKEGVYPDTFVITGYAKAGEKVQIFKKLSEEEARNSNLDNSLKTSITFGGGTYVFLGEAVAGEDNKFIASIENAPKGRYKVVARTNDYETAGTDVLVLKSTGADRPIILSLNGIELSEEQLNGDKLIIIDDNRPVIKGTAEGKVVARWSSELSTSQVVADGEFLIYPPRELEAGRHTVYLYTEKTIDDEEVRSGLVAMDFMIADGTEKAGGAADGLINLLYQYWWALLAVVLLLVAILGGRSRKAA